MRFIFFISLVIPFAGLAQDAQTRIGDYIIRETLLSDFTRTIKYRATEINNDDDLSTSERAPNDDGKGNVWIHPVKVDYLGSWPTRKELLYISDSTDAFFINFIDLDTYVVNNVFLYFYRDTLVKITYDGSEKVDDLLVDKYRHKGYKSKTTKSKSDCLYKTKAGKRIEDIKVSTDFMDTVSNVYSNVEFNLITNSDCELIKFVSVDIYDASRFKKYLDECITFLQHKKDIRSKHLNDVKKSEREKL